MNRVRLHLFGTLLVVLVLALLIGGCGAPAAQSDERGASEPTGASGNIDIVPQQPSGGDREGESSDGFGQAEPTEEASGDDSYNYPAASPTAAPTMAAAMPPAAEQSDRDAAPSSSGGGAGAPPEHPQPTAVYPPPQDVQFQDPLRAGEIDDNEDFEAYLQYRLDFQSFLGYQVFDLDVNERHIIQVTNDDGLPVLGADVFIYDGQQLVTTLHTPATGTVYFFPRAYSGTQSADNFEVIIERDQSSVEFTLTRSMTDALWPVRMDVSSTRAPVALDVLFLIDSTGSMQDEIDELKNNILSISAQIAALPTQPDVRFGMVTYRDLYDSYVTQVYDFTSDVNQFQGTLMNLRAAGGGDDPESLNQALYESLNYVSWRGGETVSLIFLVADAPPHLDYGQDYGYDYSLLQASQMGVKIMPIASRLCESPDSCSSERRMFQDQAEYIYRQMAHFTGGKYIFLTYEDAPQTSGEPGTDAHISETQYTVQDLDALVIRLIMEELGALTGQQQ